LTTVRCAANSASGWCACAQVDCDADMIGGEASWRGADRPHDRRDAPSDADAGARSSSGAGGGDAGGGGAARDVADLLSELMRAPVRRGLLLLIDFMNAQERARAAGAASGGEPAGHGGSRWREQYSSLLARCSEMALLALKRDVLSRAAALRAVTAKIASKVNFYRKS